MKPEAANWLATSEYDLETARAMLRTGRRIYVVFMCHLAVEKALKALVVEAQGSEPPRIHDLERLSALAGVTLDQALADFVGELNDASVATRYPNELNRALMQYPKSTAARYLQRTEEVLACLRADPRLQQ